MSIVPSKGFSPHFSSGWVHESMCRNNSSGSRLQGATWVLVGRCLLVSSPLVSYRVSSNAADRALSVSAQSGRLPPSSSSLSSSSAGDYPDLSGKDPDPFLSEAPPGFRSDDAAAGWMEMLRMSVLPMDGARHYSVIFASECVCACCWLQFFWNEASSSWVGSPRVLLHLLVSSAEASSFGTCRLWVCMLCGVYFKKKGGGDDWWVIAKWHLSALYYVRPDDVWYVWPEISIHPDWGLSDPTLTSWWGLLFYI